MKMPSLLFQFTRRTTPNSSLGNKSSALVRDLAQPCRRPAQPHWWYGRDRLRSPLPAASPLRNRLLIGVPSVTSVRPAIGRFQRVILELLDIGFARLERLKPRPFPAGHRKAALRSLSARECGLPPCHQRHPPSRCAFGRQHFRLRRKKRDLFLCARPGTRRFPSSERP